MNMEEFVEMSATEVLSKVKNKVPFTQEELKSLVFEEFITVKEEIVDVVGGYKVTRTVIQVNDEYIMIEWLNAISMCIDNEYEQPILVKKVENESQMFVPMEEE